MLRPLSLRRGRAAAAALAVVSITAVLAPRHALAQEDPCPRRAVRPGEPSAARTGVTPPTTGGRGLRTQVVILGSGDPVPDPDRQGPAVAIVVDSSVYLVDAGVGVVRRAAEAAAEHRIRALYPDRLARVFVTHLHSDHTLGLPDLMFTPWVMGRSTPLRAWGPAGLQAMGDRLIDAWAQDIVLRQAWDREGDTLGFRLMADELPRGIPDLVVYSDCLVKVTAFAVSHGDWNQPWNPPAEMGNRAFGYRFDTPDLSVVISGDTRPDTAAFRKFCNGCDILLHEVYAVQGRPDNPERDGYDQAFHTSTQELAQRVAPAAGPKLLVLYHATRYPGVTDAELLGEVTSVYRRRVCLAHDLDVFRQGAASPCPPAESGSRGR